MVRSRRRTIALWGAVPLAVGAVVGAAVVVSASPPHAPAVRAPRSAGEPVTDWLAQVADDRSAVPSPTAAGSDPGGPTSTPTPESTSAPDPVAAPSPSASLPVTSTPTTAGGPDLEPRDVEPPAPVPAATACLAVASVLHAWPGGYQSEVTVMAGSDALDGWLVTWTVPDGHTVGGSWGAAVTVVDGVASATSVSWSAHVDAGRSLTFGVMGSSESDPVVPEMQCSPAR